MPAIDIVDFLQNQPAPGYSARNLRGFGVDSLGEGVADASAFRVTFSAGTTVNISPGVAYLRGNSTSDQGIYRAYNSVQRQITLTAPTVHQRIDSIVLQIQDAAEDAGANNQGQVVVIQGTEDATATLDNRASAANLSTQSSPTLILLADVLINPANTPALSGSNIRDRRPFGLLSALPVVAGQRQQVMFMNPFMRLGATSWLGSTHANHQAAAAMYLPGRIAATHIRWRYLQDHTTAVGTGQSWNINVMDASGRYIGGTGPTNFVGAADSIQRPVAPFNPALPAGFIFDEGWYYVWAGLSGIAAAAQCYFMGYSADAGQNSGLMAPTQNMALRLGTGGTTLDPSNTILGMGDAYADNGFTTVLPIPQIALSIG